MPENVRCFKNLVGGDFVKFYFLESLLLLVGHIYNHQKGKIFYTLSQRIILIDWLNGFTAWIREDTLYFSRKVDSTCSIKF